MTTAALSMQLATDQVLSWLHDEASTVTSQKIQQDCIAERSGGEEAGVSRYQASLLLQELYQKNPHSYIATVVQEQSGECPANRNNSSDDEEAESIPVTTFACRQLSPGQVLNDNDITNNTTLLALAPKPSTSSTATQALEAVHESDMANLRDRLSKSSDQHNPEWFYNHADLSEIQISGNLGTTTSLPSATPEKTWHKLETDGPIVRKVVSSNTSSKPKAALKNSSNTKAVVKTTKPTTAQSFFTKKPSATNNNNNKNAARSSSSSSKNAAKPASRPAAFEKRSRKKAVVEKEEDEKEKEDDNTNTAAIGNADDFVGDEDEDSEDEQEMQERRIKSKEIVRKQKQQDELLDQLGKEQDLDMEHETPQLKTGAMDAFAKKKTTNNSSSSAAATNASTGKKRRKVLKEKTTVNAQGFLVTTTEAIWEDVSSDEEEAQAQKAKPKAASTKPATSSRPKPKPKAKKPSDMKQGSLMGFFSVKKK